MYMPSVHNGAHVDVCVYNIVYRRRLPAMHRRPLTFLGLLVEEGITKYSAAFCIILFDLSQKDLKLNQNLAQTYENGTKGIQNEVSEPSWGHLGPRSAQSRAPDAQK